MAVISGKDGSVGSYAEITDWSLSLSSNNSSYASSDTAGWKKRVAGTKDVSGSMSGKWNGTAQVAAGDEISGLVLNLDATQSYTMDACIDTFNIEVDIDDGEIIGWSADFSIRGTTTLAPTGFA